MKPALFVQDIQNIWLDGNEELRESVERRLDVINEAIAWFRKRNLPIIVGYTEDEEQGLLPGTKPFEVPDAVSIEETDHRITKRHANAFANPELGAILRREGCDTLVIVGLSASGCVLATYFSAPDWDVRAYLVKGGVASHSEEHVRFAEDIYDTVTVQALDSAFI